jgi:type II secretory pathway component HofQ
VVYNKATGQLIARNTREQLELLSALILEKANAEAGWILPKVEFRDSTLRECIGFLVAKSKKLDPAGEGVNIVLKDVDKIGDAMITLSLSNVPITEVIRYVAALAGSEVVADEFSYVIQLVGNAAAEAAAKPAAMKKAEAIVLPKIDFQEATLSEAVIFLGEKAKELDADKQGVNLILEPAAGGLEPTLTLSLANVPLSEALRYVAQLAGCEIVADDNAITLRPIEK